ncbi:MAG: hypothetical protein K1000chlam3_01109 [Chlamydiae bacterium]|nr:hypothetical protein [Chlamydiota bacterium]
MSVNLNEYKDLEGRFGLFAEIKGTSSDDLSEYDDLEEEYELFSEIRKIFSKKRSRASSYSRGN